MQPLLLLLSNGIMNKILLSFGTRYSVFDTEVSRQPVISALLLPISLLFKTCLVGRKVILQINQASI